MDTKNYDKSHKIVCALRAHFKAHGLSHADVARRLGYKNSGIVDNYLSSGRFGERAAAKWAKEFGFSEKFLMTGRGKVIDNLSGYQRMKQENEVLKSIVLAQKKTIAQLKA